MITLIKSVPPRYDQSFEVQSFYKIIKFLQGNDVGKWIADKTFGAYNDLKHKFI